MATAIVYVCIVDACVCLQICVFILCVCECVRVCVCMYKVGVERIMRARKVCVCMCMVECMHAFLRMQKNLACACIGSTNPQTQPSGPKRCSEIVFVNTYVNNYKY